MHYAYDAVIEHDKDGYSVMFPQFPGVVTFGATREEAAKRAAEVLSLELIDRIEDEEKLPAQEHVAEVVSVNVDISGEDIERSKCLTFAQAADELGVTQGNISQLASSGQLQIVTIDDHRLVTIASVEEHKANQLPAHGSRNYKDAASA